MCDPKLISREHLLRQAILTHTGLSEAIESVKQKYIIGHQYRTDNTQSIIDDTIDIHIPKFTKLVIDNLQEYKFYFPELAAEQVEAIIQEKPKILSESNLIAECFEHTSQVNQQLVGLLEWASKFPEKLSEFLNAEEVAQVMLYSNVFLAMVIYRIFNTKLLKLLAY